MNENIKKALNYLDKLGINYRYAEHEAVYTIQEANALGMVSPEAATVIRLSEDVVVTNGSGNLSLAGSVRVLANAS